MIQPLSNLTLNPISSAPARRPSAQEAGPNDGFFHAADTTGLPPKPNFASQPATQAAQSPETQAAAEAPAEAPPRPLPTIADSDRLLQPGTVVWELQPGWAHVKARNQPGKGYPDRQLPPNGAQSWSQVDENYHPAHYEAPILATRPEWADPPSLEETLSQRKLQSYEPQIFGLHGQPLNPKGPTGIDGRGLLGKHGANFAADPIVTTIDPATGKLMMIAIVREDLGEVAIPGGMVDFGEKVSSTLARELCEETLGKEEHSQADAEQLKLRQLFERATPVYQGYVDDPRNTDNSWMETQAVHLHMTGQEASQLHLQEGSDAKKVDWVPVSGALVNKMYASHGSLIKQAVLLWQQQTGLVLAQDGTVGTPPHQG